jgi:ketosteroid isomerase-like protein
MSHTNHGELSVDGKTWVPWFTYKATKVQDNEKSAVEATVRGFEQAVQDYDFDKCYSLLTPQTEWIGATPSQPGPAPVSKGLEELRQYQEAKVKITNRPYNFNVQIHGDVAWATLIVDVTMTFDNDTARAFVHAGSNEREWTVPYAESEVLLKTPQGWRIVMGHSSPMGPKE